MSELSAEEILATYELAETMFGFTIEQDDAIKHIVEAVKHQPIDGDEGDITIVPAMRSEGSNLEVGIVINQTFTHNIMFSDDGLVVEFDYQNTNEECNNLETYIWIGRRDMGAKGSKQEPHPEFFETIDGLFEEDMSMDSELGKHFAKDCIDAWKQAWRHIGQLGFVRFDIETQQIVLDIHARQKSVPSLDDLRMPLGTYPELN